MKQRCNNPNHNRFHCYGGRGISYDPKWETFEGFVEDMGLRPSIEHSLERDDVHGDYCRANCRWILKARQARNKQDTVWVTYRGQTRPLIDFLEEIDQQYSTVKARLRKGWSVEDAFEVPPKEPVRYAFAGANLTLGEWADRLGWPLTTLYDRIHFKNWSVEEALSTKPSAKHSRAVAHRRDRKGETVRSK